MKKLFTLILGLLLLVGCSKSPKSVNSFSQSAETQNIMARVEMELHHSGVEFVAWTNVSVRHLPTTKAESRCFVGDFVYNDLPRSVMYYVLLDSSGTVFISDDPDHIVRHRNLTIGFEHISDVIDTVSIFE